ncbi:stable inheritance protein KleA [Escherichia coli]|uniref:stable inheritance protein KleA n=1 Tax=Escherichia coli TaxID=562 RepID=UPI003CF6435C
MKSKIMSWLDELPGAAATDFLARRDQIAALMEQAAELTRQAEELRHKAYLQGCTLEGEAKGHWSTEEVERAKARAGW